MSIPPSDESSAGVPSLMAKALARLGGLVLEHHREHGDDRIHVARENIVEVCRALRDTPELAFDLLLDVTAIDYMGQPDGFENRREIWDRNHVLIRQQRPQRHLVNLPAPGPLGRFAVVYQLLSTKHVHRLRIKTRVPGDDPTVASVTSVWVGANWLERETYDMYGIRFLGHPDLRRIYLYEEFVGHPLRKDYGKHDEQPIQPLIGPGGQEPRRPH